jgi:hypothetical protein
MFRFMEALPDEYILSIILEWITIEDLARFDMALLNQIDRRAYLSLLRDTEHKGVLSVTTGFRYQFNSGVCDWLESRHVYMRALNFLDDRRDIPVGFLARTGQQLLKLDLICLQLSDGETGKLFARCPRLEDVSLHTCRGINNATMAKLVQSCPQIRSLGILHTSITDEGLACIGQGCRALKRIRLCGWGITDAGVSKLAAGCSSLEDVKMGNCTNITDAALAGLAKYCPRIQLLDLNNTQITVEGLAHIGSRVQSTEEASCYSLPFHNS